MSTFLNFLLPLLSEIQLYITTRTSRNKIKKRNNAFFRFHQTTYFIFQYFLLYWVLRI